MLSRLSFNTTKVFLFFVFVFILGKGSQFFIPIFLSNLLDPINYGAIEFAMSVGLIVVSIISLGSSAFISRSIVKKESWIDLNIVKLYLGVMSFLLITISIFLHFINGFPLIKISLAFSSIILLQGAISAELKSNSRRNSAIIVDVTLWITIFVWAFLYTSYKETIFNSNDSLFQIIFIHNVILLALFIRSIDFIGISTPRNPFRYFNEGSKIVIMMFISSIVATSGRLIVGNNFGLEAVGQYSSLYRISIVPIIAHQMIMLFFYRTSFSKKKKHFVYLGNSVFVIISVISLLVWLIASHFSIHLGQAFDGNLRSNPIVFSALMAIVPFWSAISVNELAYSQNVKSSMPLFYSLFYVVLAFFVIVFVVPPSDLDTASVSIAIIIIGYCFLNSISLDKAGVSISKLPIYLCLPVIIGLLYLLNLKF